MYGLCAGMYAYLCLGVPLSNGLKRWEAVARVCQAGHLAQRLGEKWLALIEVLGLRLEPCQEKSPMVTQYICVLV